MRRALLAAAPIILIAVAPSGSRADTVGAAFGAGTGLVVAGPPGAVVGGIIGAVWGAPFWGPPVISIGIAGITMVGGTIIELML